MNRVYDNGCILLGRKDDIVEYSKRLINKLDYKEDIEQMLEEIKDYNDSTILAINYDNAMGISIEYWEDTDRVYDYCE